MVVIFILIFVTTSSGHLGMVLFSTGDHVDDTDNDHDDDDNDLYFSLLPGKGLFRLLLLALMWVVSPF